MLRRVREQRNVARSLEGDRELTLALAGVGIAAFACFVWAGRPRASG